MPWKIFVGGWERLVGGEKDDGQADGGREIVGDFHRETSDELELAPVAVQTHTSGNRLRAHVSSSSDADGQCLVIEVQLSSSDIPLSADNLPLSASILQLSSSDMEADVDGVPAYSVMSQSPGSAAKSNTPRAIGATYMESLNMQSGLHVVVEAKVAKAYRDNGEYGFFSLFYFDTFSPHSTFVDI
ncbi:hypothetical protein GN958_ATG17240 [Phytophthora infestans]|uniref:Uncharacterized protein n=1 Tax=Phytophthora infestans TaxID=4787 RepID=A0A8S9U0S9_PHYIN|nr:hypothetical protein GN958_ATG17240 [Phytophthora infestans]